jgi:tetratricopeptide (TPR) repeat protein
LEKDGDLVGAEQAYRRADAAGGADGASNLGVLLFERGDVEAARAALERADSRGSGMGAFRLGFLLQETGQTVEAEQAYRRGVERGNKHAANNLAVMLRQRGDHAGAREVEQRIARATGGGGADGVVVEGRRRGTPASRVNSAEDDLAWLSGLQAGRTQPRAAGDELVDSSGVGTLHEAVAPAESLFRSGQYEAARAAFVAVIGEYRRILQSRPADLEVNVQIAGALNNLGLCLGKLRRYDEAAEVLQAAATIFEGLCEHDTPEKWRPFLAGTLQSLAGAWGDGMRYERALPVSRRAVELRRTCSRGPDLARTLRMFAHVRAGAGTELTEAMTVVEEALALYLTALTSTGDAAYLDEVYTTQLVQSLLLSRQGHYDAARRVADSARSRSLDGVPSMLRHGETPTPGATPQKGPPAKRRSKRRKR